MARRRTTFDLTLPARDSRLPAYRWLYAAVRAEILEGRLKPGARLPSSRDLAEQYDLARGTVVIAFQQLESEGYIAGTVGSGTYVSKVLPDDLLHVPRDSRRQPARTKPRRRVSDYAGRVSLFPPYAAHPGRAFRANVPALELFPTTLWAQIAGRRMRRLSTTLLLGSGAMGYLPLREAVAEYLGTSRGVKCVPEQIAIVSGMQEALDLTARIFLNRGDRVCMEDPGYIGATIAFEAAGAKIIGLPVDREGVVLRRSSLRGSRLVYVTPAHQFPLGVTMSLSRRLELLEWARQSGAMILEDDYDSEYRYSGPPVPALQGLDQNDRVLFAGSFSKVLFPSLRLGYLVVPRDLVPTFDAVKSATNRHASLLDQAVLCDFIVEGHFGRHLRRMRQVYAERLSILIESARQRLTGLLDVSPIEAGLQTVGWLPAGIDGKRVAKAAAARKVHVTPLSEYSRGPMERDGLQLGFAAIDPHEIRRGVRELSIALSEVGVRSGKST
jgi:GntR family transcriptional regulator/MocR family aminotransferase